MQNIRKVLNIFLFTILWQSMVQGQDEPQLWTSSRPDGHAPIGVMGDHVHKKGEWMVSYRFMTMSMKDNFRKADEVSDSEVLETFMIVPLEMTMNMHMLGVMYAISDRVTLMGMLNYTSLSMDHVTRADVFFTTESSSLDDTRLTVLYNIFSKNRHSIHLNAGLNIPTGSLDNRDATPMGDDQKLPYPMQIGSGTWDIMPGATYLGQTDRFSWGAQAVATLRPGENDEGYTFGDRVMLTSWVAYRWQDWISTSFRLNATSSANINGNDPDLNPALVQTANPDLFGGEQFFASLGANLLFPGNLSGARLGLEYALPLYQNLNGPQLGINNSFTVGIQYTF